MFIEIIVLGTNNWQHCTTAPKPLLDILLWLYMYILNVLHTIDLATIQQRRERLRMNYIDVTLIVYTVDTIDLD